MAACEIYDPAMFDFAQLCEQIEKAAHGDAPVIVAVGGFGGSGKSTLTRQLSRRFDSAVISGDDFTVGRQVGRSDDWASIDRNRLVEQVLSPVTRGESAKYQRYDWPTDELADWIEVPPVRVLFVEGIGIIHPDLLEYFALSVWVDCSLEVAAERGRYRDKEIYKVDHDDLWRDTWAPNDRDYFDRFRPDQLADIVYKPEKLAIGADRPRHEVAIVVVRDREGWFHIHERRHDRKVFPGRWGVGTGGKLEPGEPADVAARRELLEEAKVDGEPVFCFDMIYEDDTVSSEMHVFEIDVDRNEVGFDDTEWAQDRWVTRDELLHLATETELLCPDTAVFTKRYLMD